MTDLSANAVERLAVIHDNLASVKGTLPATADGNRKTAATLRALLAAKEAAEAREREAVMQSLAHLGQAQEAYEAQKAAEAEAAALREVVNQCRLAFGGYVDARTAVDMIDTLDQPKEDKTNE